MTMYTPRQLISKSGLSQEEALLSIQEHPEFTRRSAKVSSIRRRGDSWVVTVLEKTAGPFPPDGGEDEGPPKDDGPAESPDDDDDSEAEGSAPDGGGESGPPKSKGEGKGGELNEVLHLLQSIADALGVVGPDAMGAHGPAGPDMMGPGPDGPPAPPPHGGPAPGMGGPPGGHGEPHGTKLKPGEVPNRPGVVPVGAPAFASVQTRVAKLHDPQQQVKIAQAVRNFKETYPAATPSQVKREGEYIRILFS